MSWVERYVGIPFKADGLGFQGCNCWGLVRLVYLTEKSIELPAYGEESAAGLLAMARAIGSESKRPPWLPVEGDWKPFDVVLMHGLDREGTRVPLHVGVTDGRDKLLHVECSTSAVFVPKTHSSVKSRIITAVRHEALV